MSGALLTGKYQYSAPSMFKHYRNSGCVFECRLKYAITKANCIPWDYPVPSGIDEAEYDMCVSDAKGKIIDIDFQVS